MPIAPNPRLKFNRALVIGVLAVIIGVGVVIGIILLNERGDVQINFGDNEFSPGNVQDLSQLIQDGGPIIYGDPNESDASIYVQLLGNEDWTAFRAHRDGCRESIDWESEPQVFRDPCDAKVIINSNGCSYDSTTSGVKELEHYMTRIEDNALVVELDNPDTDFCNP